MRVRFGVVALLALAAVASFGCSSTDEAGYRFWKHIEWHLHGAYQDLVGIHQFIDRQVFNLDERNPDRY